MEGGQPSQSTMDEFRHLMDKAYAKFARLRELPPYGRNRWEAHFQKAFQTYSKLWKFQQDNRQALMDLGLRRWEIGEIASRIGQLYYNYFLRTSEATFLFEAYIFYEAILQREYFKDSSKDASLANKQLRYFARFLVVCLLLNRREMVRRLLRQLRTLVDDYARIFQASDSREWKSVVREITRFIKADAACESARPLRYSLAYDPHPSTLVASGGPTRPRLKLQDVILTSYYYSEVKISELTLDTFRMLQAVEWEPSGAFHRRPSRVSVQDTGGAPPPGRTPTPEEAPQPSTTGGGIPAQAGGSTGPPVSMRAGGSGRGAGELAVIPRRVGGLAENIVDPSLPPNTHKHILYRPTVSHLLVVLAAACEELPPDSCLLLYISAASSPYGIPHQLPVSDRPQLTPEGALEDNPPSTSSEVRPPSGTTAVAVSGAPAGVAAAVRIAPAGRSDSPAGSSDSPSSSPGTGAILYRPGSGSSAHQRRGLYLGSKGDGGAASTSGSGSGGLEAAPRRGSPADTGGGEREVATKSGVRTVGDMYLYPSDLMPFTRRPLFVVIDSDASAVFEAISGEERGEPAVLLLSPRLQPISEEPRPSVPDSASGSAAGMGSATASIAPWQIGGSLFTLFLTSPLEAFCRLVGRASLPQQPLYDDCERTLADILSGWGRALDNSPSCDTAWARLLGDPFLRQFILRFVFCRATLALHVAYHMKPDYHPHCCPALPSDLAPSSPLVMVGLRELATKLGCIEVFSGLAPAAGTSQTSRRDGTDTADTGPRSQVLAEVEESASSHVEKS